MTEQQQILSTQILKNAIFLHNLVREDARKQEQVGNQDGADSQNELADLLLKYSDDFLMPKREMRKQTMEHIVNDTQLLDLPVIKTGSVAELHQFAADEGLVWKNSPKQLFGGYYYKTPLQNGDGYCLLIT